MTSLDLGKKKHNLTNCILIKASCIMNRFNLWRKNWNGEPICVGPGMFHVSPKAEVIFQYRQAKANTLLSTKIPVDENTVDVKMKG